MTEQLAMHLDEDRRTPPVAADWRLDARTRATGLRGLARARAALAAAAQPESEHQRVHAA